MLPSLVDFKKAYDSIDRDTLIYTLEEFGTDNETLTLFKKSLAGTMFKVMFLGEISDSSEIKIGVREEDGSSSIIFYSVLEKVIKE